MQMPSTNCDTKLYKKCKKIIPTRSDFTTVFASTFRSIDSYGTWGNTGGDICISSAMCSTTYKKELGVAGSTFDGGWVTTWWQDVGGAAENGVSCECRRRWKSRCTWRCIVDKSGSGIPDGDWNFSWDDCGVWNEEEIEVDEIISLLGLVDDV